MATSTVRGAGVEIPGGSGTPPEPGTLAAWSTDGTNIPSGWFECDGSFVSKVTYADLFAAIGTTYGDGGTTFGLPDLNNRVPIGAGDASTETSQRGLADVGGTEDHTLTLAQFPNHTHSSSVSAAPTTVNGPFMLAPGGTGGAPTLNDAGGGGAHNNLDAYATVLWLIKT